MENVPMHFREESLQFFEKHQHRIMGLDHVISEMKKPYNDSNHRKQVVTQFVDYFDKNGTVKLYDFDPELAEYVYS